MSMVGRARHRVLVRKKTRVSDAGGGASTDWTTLFEIWADINPISAYHRLVAEQVKSGVTHRVRTRSRAGILPSMSILFGTRTLIIRGIVNEGERGKWLTLDCEEVQT